LLPSIISVEKNEPSYCSQAVLRLGRISPTESSKKSNSVINFSKRSNQALRRRRRRRRRIRRRGFICI